MAVVMNSVVNSSVRNKILVENGYYRAIGRPVRDEMLVENGNFYHISSLRDAALCVNTSFSTNIKSLTGLHRDIYYSHKHLKKS
jgi:hypothetical protein